MDHRSNRLATVIGRQSLFRHWNGKSYSGRLASKTTKERRPSDTHVRRLGLWPDLCFASWCSKLSLINACRKPYLIVNQTVYDLPSDHILGYVDPPPPGTNFRLNDRGVNLQTLKIDLQYYLYLLQHCWRGVNSKKNCIKSRERGRGKLLGLHVAYDFACGAEPRWYIRHNSDNNIM